MLKGVAVGSLACGLLLSAVGGTQAKKYLSFGWEFRDATAKALVANADRLADTAFDGVGIYLNGATNSVGEELKFVARGAKWEKEAFKDVLPDLKVLAKTPHLSESLLVGCFGAPVKRFAWTDDAAWENLGHSLGVVGWLTRESGIKGLWCDYEDYHGQNQFTLTDADPSWEEMQVLARKRGAQVFGPLFRENPNVRLLFCWVLTFPREYFNAPDVRAMAKGNGDLWPAFLNGILDVMPETARLIDGDEHCYRAESRQRDFHYSYAKQRTVCPQLVAPEHREKYLRQTGVSFGLYFDSYVNPAGHGWYMEPANGSRAERLRRNLLDATRLADEYVWFWGEMNTSAKWGADMRVQKSLQRRDKTWDEQIGGVNEAMRCCKDPDWGLARRLKELKAKGELVDLVSNPKCENRGEKRSLPSPYGFWKPKNETKAEFFLDETTGHGDSSSISMRNAKLGTIILDIPNVKGGDTYAVMFAAKGGPLDARVNWHTKTWWNRSQDDVGFVLGAPDADGWRTACSMVIVPEGVDVFSVLFTVKDKKNRPQIWVDDIHVVKLW